MKAFNGSGRSPQKLTIEYVRGQGVTGNNIPASNLNCVTVPGLSHIVESARAVSLICAEGAAAAWVDTVEKLGSGNVTLAEVLAPAIRLAEEG